MTTPLKFNMPSCGESRARDALYFYPDVLHYQFDRTQYQSQWAKLSEESGGYLSVKDGQLNRVGWLRYSFERLMGWFGFGNACHPAKVRMAAQKLAYFGYLNGFNRDNTLAQDNTLAVIEGWDSQYQPSPVYVAQSKEARSDGTSANLQRQLIEFYQQHAGHLDALYQSSPRLPLPHRDRSFPFGATYAVNYDFVSMAHLDVQDQTLLTNVIRRLENRHGKNTLPESTARRVYINYWLGKIQERFNALYQTQPRSVPRRFLSVLLWDPPSTPQLPSFQELEPLHQEAQAAIELWPQLINEHVDLFIKLKMALIGRLQSDTGSRKQELYRSAYTLITERCDPPQSYEYMQRHFLERDGFAVLDVNSEFVQSWGPHLLESLTRAGTEGGYLYQLAQICPGSIPRLDLKRYIDSCLEARDYSAALVLIERLFEDSPEAAVKYVESRREISSLLKEAETPLSRAYAKKLVTDGNRTSSRLAAAFGFSSEKQRYEEAALVDPDVVAKEAAPHFFKELVKAQSWKEAELLLQKRRKAGLPLSDIPLKERMRLANHYVEEGVNLYKQGKLLLLREGQYRQSLAKMESAIAVVDTDQGIIYKLNKHRRLLAGVLIDETGRTLARVREALVYLEAAEQTACSKADRHLPECHILALGYHIQLLHEACLGAGSNEYLTATATHKARCADTLSELMRSIDRLISLCNKFHLEGEHAKQLAAAHFIKAECINYFELTGDAINHYRKACEFMPKQPFYHLRLSETLTAMDTTESDASRESGAALLPGCGINAIDYRNWFDERWQMAAARTFKISIPEVEAAPPRSSFFF